MKMYEYTKSANRALLLDEILVALPELQPTLLPESDWALPDEPSYEAVMLLTGNDTSLKIYVPDGFAKKRALDTVVIAHDATQVYTPGALGTLKRDVQR